MKKKITPDVLRRMSACQLTSLMEERLGIRLPVDYQVKLSMLVGAGDAGIGVVDPSPGGEAYTERLDYEKLAELLNDPQRSAKTPPTQ